MKKHRGRSTGQYFITYFLLRLFYTFQFNSLSCNWWWISVVTCDMAVKSFIFLHSAKICLLHQKTLQCESHGDIFYGYPKATAAKTTKTAERISWIKKHITDYVIFDESLSSTKSQENFLSNGKMTQRLISMLCVQFQKEGFVVK